LSKKTLNRCRMTWLRHHAAKLRSMKGARRRGFSRGPNHGSQSRNSLQRGALSITCRKSQKKAPWCVFGVQSKRKARSKYHRAHTRSQAAQTLSTGGGKVLRPRQASGHQPNSYSYSMEKLGVVQPMNTARKLGPHTHTNQGMCPGVGL
jgi:hypothetical protein